MNAAVSPLTTLPGSLDFLISHIPPTWLIVRSAEAWRPPRYLPARRVCISEGQPPPGKVQPLEHFRNHVNIRLPLTSAYV